MNTPPKMDHPEAEQGTQIVYIRQVPLDMLPGDIRDRIGDVEQVWGVHTADGECLALARDRTLAFVVARQNEMKPVSAH